MRIGIFSDIHGNIYAFEKVWEELRKEACDLYCFLGDICGYYYHADEVINKLRTIDNLICVRGNHDEMFLNMLNDGSLEEKFTGLYGKAYSHLKKDIADENLKFLADLPETYVLEDNNIGIYHGSPWDHTGEYVYPTDSFERFKEMSFDAVLMGHTHYPLYREIEGMHIMNPGSCGQPRDKYPPSYAVFDTESEKFELKHVEYNREDMIRDIKKNEESGSYLETVLMRW